MRKPILVFGTLLIASAAQAIVWAPNPSPGGTVAAPATGKEMKRVTYRITAQDRDSSSPDGKPSSPVTIQGDEMVQLFKGYEGDGAPSGTLLLMVQSGFDGALGTRTYDMTVRLKSVVGRDDVTVADPYASGDMRMFADDQCDKHVVANPPGFAPDRTPLNQTVTVQSNKADVEGKVKDAQTALPIAGASLVVQNNDPDYMAMMTTTTTDVAGNYLVHDFMAGPLTLTAGAGGYVSQTVTSSVAAGGTLTQNFNLAHTMGGGWPPYP